MKRSLKILKFFFALFCVAVVFGLINLDPLFGFTGIMAVSPLLFAHIEDSNDAKSKRRELRDQLHDMIDLMKKEKRSFTADEQKKYDTLDSDYRAMNNHVDLLESQEKRDLMAAGKQAQKVHEDFRRSNSRDKWIDQNTGREVHILDREDRAANIFHVDNESQRLSLGKAIRSLILNDWKGAEPEQRALSTSSGNGLLVPFLQFPEILDYARAKSVCADAGAKFVVMDAGNMSIVRITSDPTFETKAENEPFTGSSMQMDAVPLAAHTVGCFLSISRELAQDAPNFAGAISNALAKALGQYIDQLALAGSGDGEPKGILNTDYVGSVTGEALLHNGHMVALWNAIASQNGQCKTFVMHPRERAFLASQFHGNGYVQPPALLEPLQWLDTTAIPSNLGFGENESTVIGGDFSQLLIGVRDSIRVEISHDAVQAFARHQVLLKITARVDVALQHPRHFAKVIGVLTPTDFYNLQWPVLNSAD